MTESEWLSLSDPWQMVEHLAGPIERIRGPQGTLRSVIATDRQCLLWGCACCRRLGGCVEDTHWLDAIRIVEQFADGEATYPQMLAMGEEMEKWFLELGSYESCTPTSMVARACADLSGGADSAFDSMRTPFLSPAYDASRWAVAAIREKEGEAAGHKEQVLQCDFLRDIIGNPFRPATLHEAFQTANIQGLAEQIYQNRSFERLPELAMALIQAECHDGTILQYCHSEGPHVRGCWVVDLFRRVENQLRWK